MGGCNFSSQDGWPEVGGAVTAMTGEETETGSCTLCGKRARAVQSSTTGRTSEGGEESEELEMLEC